MKHHHRQRGAALLMAMLTVGLVASLASAALWLQWRQVEIEGVERQQAQAHWLLTGAFDWTRLILAEDARATPQADHLGEPWAIPVQESRLSTFLSQDQTVRADDPEVYLSGQITDAQSRLNLLALATGSQETMAIESAAWTRLFRRLDLPSSDLDILLLRWPQAVKQMGHPDVAPPANAPLIPRRLDQFAWLGVSPGTLNALAPYVTLLPTTTPVNLNTASAPVLEAVIPGLDSSAARQLVARRNLRPWGSLQEAAEALGPLGKQLDHSRHGVSSKYFEIHGRIRIDDLVQEELALVQRDGLQVRMLWRRTLAPQASQTRLLQ